jgi:hypothetical protein
MKILKAGLACLFLMGCAHSKPSSKIDVSLLPDQPQKQVTKKDFDKAFAVLMDYRMAYFKDVPWMEPVVRELNLNLINQGKVQMAVVVESNVGQDYNQSLETVIESLYLKAYREYGDFTLVERSEIDRILKEHHLTYSGLIAGGATEPGKILPLTHILYVSTKYQETGKLLDVRNGRISAAYARDPNR